MKRILIPILTLVVVAAIFIFAVSGCREEEFSRYPAIAIPHYSSIGYYAMLSDKNPAIVYNAVCNLGAEAYVMAEALTADDADKESNEYKMTVKIYKKIVELLKSKDPKVLAASLRFLQLFSESNYKNEELVKPIMKVKSRNEQVKYEQVMALVAVVDKDTRINLSFVKNRLDDKSWLVSRAAYLLVNKLENDKLRMKLIQGYKRQQNEAEKLLILTALKENFSDRVFQFLSNEVLNTKSTKIKSQIFDMLPYAKNKKRVLNWIDKNYGKFSDYDIRTLAYSCAGRLDSDFSSSLMVILLKRGFSPDDSFFTSLNDSINGYTKEEELSDVQKKKLKNLRAVERAVLADSILKARSIALKVKKPEINPELLAEYNAAVNQFIAQTEAILVKYQVEPVKIETCLKDMPLLEDYLVEKLSE